MRDSLALALIRAEICRAYVVARRPPHASPAGAAGATAIARSLRSLRGLGQRHSLRREARLSRSVASDSSAE
jgi:hypothetical protein